VQNLEKDIEQEEMNAKRNTGGQFALFRRGNTNEV